MLFFPVCFFILLLRHRCDGHDALFEFNQYLLHVHVFNVYRLAIVSFFVYCFQIVLYADLSKKKIKNRMNEHLMMAIDSKIIRSVHLVFHKLIALSLFF